jgi:transposase
VQVRQLPRLGRKVAVTHRGHGRCHAGSADLMAHHLVRLVVAPGHEVRLMPPEYVRPRVEAQKNDGRDAEGLAGAASRPTMWFVA